MRPDDKKFRPANYGDATPEEVALALLLHRPKQKPSTRKAGKEQKPKGATGARTRESTHSYTLRKDERPPKTPAKRIKWMCGRYGIAIPPWATRRGGGVSGSLKRSPIRSAALHEALYMDEPLGFAATEDPTTITLQMKAVVCRILVSLMGGKDEQYFQSKMTRSRHGISLGKP